MNRIVLMFLICGIPLILSFQGAQDEIPRYGDSHLVEQMLTTLPAMFGPLKECGIEVSPVNFIWPAEAGLHPQGLRLLEENGYSTLQREGLLAITRAWFLMNYDSLNQHRQQIITASSEQMTENPYLSDEQKRINLRLLHKELGLSREDLEKKVNPATVKMLRPYSLILKEMWRELEEAEQEGEERY